MPVCFFKPNICRKVILICFIYSENILMDMLAKLSKLLKAVDEQSDDSSQVRILTFPGYLVIFVSELKP